MKGEFHRGHGVKISLLKSLIARNTDFFVLTEARTPPHLVRNVKLKKRLLPTQHSLHPEARGGVIVYSKSDHQIIPDSHRTGSIPGHLTLAVYEISGSRTIVGGVYGPSENNDKLSSKFFREMLRIIDELQTIYRTKHIILAGDFNSVWRHEDCNNFLTKKKHTMRTFQHLLDSHHLSDLGFQASPDQHTWFRRGTHYQSSRIDYILTNIPTTGLDMQKSKFTQTLTIFDHSFLSATFGQKIEKCQ
jgi:exonuclease III